jgi:hypothetical protein
MIEKKSRHPRSLAAATCVGTPDLPPGVVEGGVASVPLRQTAKVVHRLIEGWLDGNVLLKKEACKGPLRSQEGRSASDNDSRCMTANHASPLLPQVTSC